MKSRFPVAGMTVALAVLLAACADKPADADADGKSIEEAAAEMKDKAVKMRPGQYRTTIRIDTLEMPKAEGMPADFVDSFKQSMQASMQPTESCLTQEMVDLGPEQMISQGQKDCSFSKLDIDGGKFDATMVCTPAPGGRVESTISGNMTETRSEFRTTSELENPQMPGKMKMGLSFVVERVGECATG